MDGSVLSVESLNEHDILSSGHFPAILMHDFRSKKLKKAIHTGILVFNA